MTDEAKDELKGGLGIFFFFTAIMAIGIGAANQHFAEHLYAYALFGFNFCAISFFWMKDFYTGDFWL